MVCLPVLVLACMAVAATSALYVRSYYILEGFAVSHSPEYRVITRPGLIQISFIRYYDVTVDAESGVERLAERSWPAEAQFLYIRSDVAPYVPETGVFGFGWSTEAIEMSTHRQELRLICKSLTCPIGSLLIVPLIVIALGIRHIIRLRRLAKTDVCANCGYDLRASIDRCPECGTLMGELRI